MLGPSCSWRTFFLETDPVPGGSVWVECLEKRMNKPAEARRGGSLQVCLEEGGSSVGRRQVLATPPPTPREDPHPGRQGWIRRADGTAPPLRL